MQRCAHTRASAPISPPSHHPVPRRGGLKPPSSSAETWVAPNAAIVQRMIAKSGYRFSKRSCANKHLFRQRDRVDVAAVIRLGPVRGAAVTEEPYGVRVGAEAQVFDPFDFSALEPRPDVAGQIEHRVLGTDGRREKAIVPGIRRLETLDEFGADLVVRLADHRAERRLDAAAA